MNYSDYIVLTIAFSGWFLYSLGSLLTLHQLKTQNPYDSNIFDDPGWHTRLLKVSRTTQLISFAYTTLFAVAILLTWFGGVMDFLESVVLRSSPLPVFGGYVFLLIFGIAFASIYYIFNCDRAYSSLGASGSCAHKDFKSAV